jgi:hypothetical protein
MFTDMTPIKWRQDPLRLIVRKCLRKMISSKVMLALMERIVVLLDQNYSSPKILRPLYRWIEGAYIYQGYQHGLREFGSVSEPGLAS